MRAVGAGDESAFECLYDLVAAQVWAAARRVLRDRAQAEEVMQEALVQVWRTAARFDAAKGSPLGWICTIAHRRAVDRVRAEQAATIRAVKAGMTWLATGSDEVADTVADDLERQQIKQCLAALTPLQHQAVTLAYYHGHTYRQVADLLGIPLPTVKSRIHDGLIRLRNCLGARTGDLSQPPARDTQEPSGSRPRLTFGPGRR